MQTAYGVPYIESSKLVPGLTAVYTISCEDIIDFVDGVKVSCNSFQLQCKTPCYDDFFAIAVKGHRVSFDPDSSLVLLGNKVDYIKGQNQKQIQILGREQQIKFVDQKNNIYEFVVPQEAEVE